MIPFSSFYWDPKPEIVIIPWLGVPILWYGVLFALGFILGFPIFVGVLERFFLQRPEFEEREIIGELNLPRFAEAAKRGKAALVKELNNWLASDELEGTRLPKKSAFFASCSFHPQRALKRLKMELLVPHALYSLKKQAVLLADRLTVYMVIATVVGARLGHYVFYERPSEYLRHPLEILQIWKGGLASHGAAIAIAIALGIFNYRYKSQSRQLTWLHLLDFVSIPTALAGAFIRVGNFFNQEILGVATDVPWAVVFGHPADHSLPVPRHPVQLYEALVYGVIFVCLWRLSFRAKYLMTQGKLLGIFLILVFGFRFIVESWKEEQSHLLSSALTMGQILSIPAILIGILLFFRRARFRQP
jgi:prolipoprotein diacylglyceryl transferase